MKKLQPILLLEDDDVDAKILERTFQNLNIPNSIIRAKNGVEGLEILSECDELPFLIFLDLNMPKMNGLEFLKKVKEDPSIKTIPIIVLTTSDNENDVKTSFERGANGFMIKSSDFNEFMQTVKKIEDYWRASKMPC